MAIVNITGLTDADLTALKQRVDAEIAARDRFPDETVSALVAKVQELHGCEVDPVAVRCILNADVQVKAT